MSCLPWGYANKITPVFFPVSADNNLIVHGNALVNGGRLTVGNNLSDFLNDRGSFLQMTPSNPVSPILAPPLYYYFQANPEDRFLLARINTPPPAKNINSTILRIAPVSASASSTDENSMTINAQTTCEGSLISKKVISGYSGIKYRTEISLGPFDNPPRFNYNGATLLLKPYPTADGGIYLILPSDFFTNEIYIGTTIFRFIFPQATTDQVIAIYKNDLTLVNVCQPDTATITEAIWNGTTVEIFSYPYIVTPQDAPTLRSLPPPVLLGSEPPEDLPLGKLS